MQSVPSSPSSLSSSLGVIFGGVLVAAIIAVGCQTPSGGGSAGGASRGERFFKTKCNSCHPGGGQGAGPPIDASIAPDFLERGKTSGRHAVPEADWEPLLAYINQTLGGGAAVVEAPPAPPPAPGVAPPPPPGPPAVSPVVAVAAAGDSAAGGQYFQSKCAKCHPGGAKIAGKAIPGVLVAGGSGKHGVDAAQFDNVLSFLVTLGAVRAGAPATVATTTPPVTSTPTAVAPTSGGGDIGAGGQYFQAKCAKCHPGGAKIAGKTVPGTKMVSGGSGKHGIEAAQFDNVMAFLVTLGAIRTGGGPTVAGPGGGGAVTPPPPPPPPPTTGDGTIPMNAGMVPCSCSCQCPAGAPPEALPAACICQCSCPR